MKYVLAKIKKCAMIVLMVLCVGLSAGQMPMTAYAYTQEEIDAAKAWLSANGYSPDMGGAQAAYADYMNGKFGAIPGLPEPNNTTPPATQEPQPEAAKPEEPEEDKPQKEKPETDTEQEDAEEHSPESGQAAQPDSEPRQEAVPRPESVPEVEGSDEPADAAESAKIADPTTEQQEFADMINVFASSFSEDDQEDITEAKERLERQKQERAQAEKESEDRKQEEHKPQKNIVILLCGVLILAVIGLGIIMGKKKKG